MKLNDLQSERLYELSHSTGCVSPGDAPLETLGLVVTGRSRFGEWVKLTDDGRQYVSRTLARGGRAASLRGTGNTVQPFVTRSDDAPSSQLARASSRGAAPRIRRKAATNQEVKTGGAGARSAESGEVATSRPVQPSIAVAMSTAGDVTVQTAPPVFAPNAVRVTVGKRITYYPLAAAKAIKHGTIEYVRTSRKPFSSAAVGAPGTDSDILCGAPASP